MQIDKKTDQLLQCECGHTPADYSIGYGRYPYYMQCDGCKKSLHGGSGMPEGEGSLFPIWNNGIRFISARGKTFQIAEKLPHIKDPRDEE